MCQNWSASCSKWKLRHDDPCTRLTCGHAVCASTPARRDRHAVRVSAGRYRCGQVRHPPTAARCSISRSEARRESTAQPPHTTDRAGICYAQEVRRLTPTSWACLAAACMSLLAVGSWPYGYYVLLRWVACSVSIMAGVVLLRRRLSGPALPAWVLAVLFNPIWRVPFGKMTWRVLDVIASVAFIALALATRAARSTEKDRIP